MRVKQSPVREAEKAVGTKGPFLVPWFLPLFQKDHTTYSSGALSFFFK